jgi:hypothetical protein
VAPRIHCPVFLSAGLGLAFLALGCGDHNGSTQPQEDSVLVAQGTPLRCVQSLAAAYNARDLDQYTRLLTDDFTFVFGPQIPNRLDPRGSSWGVRQELDSAAHLFSSASVRQLLVRFDISVPEPSAEHPGTWRVRLSNVQLYVQDATIAGPPQFWQVQNGKASLYLKETVRPSDGRSVWMIQRWEDDPLTDGGTHPTWSDLKEIYS